MIMKKRVINYFSQSHDIWLTILFYILLCVTRWVSARVNPVEISSLNPAAWRCLLSHNAYNSHCCLRWFNKSSGSISLYYFLHSGRVEAFFTFRCKDSAAFKIFNNTRQQVVFVDYLLAEWESGVWRKMNRIRDNCTIWSSSLSASLFLFRPHRFVVSVLLYYRVLCFKDFFYYAVKLFWRCYHLDAIYWTEHFVHSVPTSWCVHCIRLLS